MFFAPERSGPKTRLSMGKVYIFLQPHVREQNYGYIYMYLYIFLQPLEQSQKYGYIIINANSFLLLRMEEQ